MTWSQDPLALSKQRSLSFCPQSRKPHGGHVDSSAPGDRDVTRLSPLSQASTELFPMVERAVWTKRAFLCLFMLLRLWHTHESLGSVLRQDSVSAVLGSWDATFLVCSEAMPTLLVPTLRVARFPLHIPNFHSEAFDVAFWQRSSVKTRGRGLIPLLWVEGRLSSEAESIPQVSHLGKSPSDHPERKFLPSAGPAHPKPRLKQSLRNQR